MRRAVALHCLFDVVMTSPWGKEDGQERRRGTTCTFMFSIFFAWIFCGGLASNSACNLVPEAVSLSDLRHHQLQLYTLTTRDGRENCPCVFQILLSAVLRRVKEFDFSKFHMSYNKYIGGVEAPALLHVPGFSIFATNVKLLLASRQTRALRLSIHRPVKRPLAALLFTFFLWSLLSNVGPLPNSSRIPRFLYILLHILQEDVSHTSHTVPSFQRRTNPSVKTAR